MRHSVESRGTGAEASQGWFVRHQPATKNDLSFSSGASISNSVNFMCAGGRLSCRSYTLNYSVTVALLYLLNASKTEGHKRGVPSKVLYPQ